MVCTIEQNSLIECTPNFDIGTFSLQSSTQVMSTTCTYIVGQLIFEDCCKSCPTVPISFRCTHYDQTFEMALLSPVVKPGSISWQGTAADCFNRVFY